MTSETPTALDQSPVPSWAVWLGMLVIYIVWSSTYLAIRFAVETIPPFAMAAFRFLVAGFILYLLRVAKGDPKPSRIEWRSTALIGFFLIVGGNGGVSFAEQKIVSSIAALMVGATPLWIIVVDALRPEGKRPGWMAFVGVIIGFIGMVLLFNPWTLNGSATANEMRIDSIGMLALLVASLSWAVGSVYSREVDLPRSPLLATGMEMIAGGVGLLLLSLAAGEWQEINLGLISSRSIGALAYLTLFGSLLAFATYTWLLRVAPITLVSTYAYVNPLVAIVLGAVFAAEPVTPELIFSALLIVSSVGMISTANLRTVRRRKKRTV